MNVENANRPHTNNRRRNFLVNPAFQWKYAIMVGLGVFLTTSVLSCVLYATLYEEARQHFVMPATASLDAGFMILLYSFLFSIMTAGTVVILSVFTSHRVCGPLFVLQGYFNQIISGKIPTPRPLRKKGEFKEVFASFVHATLRLKSDQREKLETYEKLLAITQEANRQDEQACSSALSAIAGELTDLRNELATAMEIERTPVPNEGEANPALNKLKEPAHAGV